MSNNHTLNNVRIRIKNDTKANWESNNPVLLRGEFGVEIDTRRFKIGDGSTNWTSIKYAAAGLPVVASTGPSASDSNYDIGTIWINDSAGIAYILYSNVTSNAVWKRVVTPDDLSSLGAGDMTKFEFATNGTYGVVDLSVNANKLTAGRVIGMTGDVESVGTSFDGSQNITITNTLKNVVTAGEYTKVTVDAKGRVVDFDNLAASDIPNLTSDKITDLGTAATKDVGTSPGDVVLIESDGKISSTVMPSLAIVEIFEVSSQAEMLALVGAEQGDICIINLSTGAEVYILKGGSSAVLSNWVRLNIPTGSILTINGKSGASVTLTTTDVAEGTNLYYTDTRATANFGTNFVLSVSTDLADGDKILHSDDLYILNGGNSSI